MTISERTQELIYIYGASVAGRAWIIESLMAEFDITPDSAIQHIASAKRRMAGLRKGGRRAEPTVPRMVYHKIAASSGGL